VAVVANEIERRHAVVVASNRLPIDDAGAYPYPNKKPVWTSPSGVYRTGERRSGRREGSPYLARPSERRL
jgi:hypothetical protein